MAVSTTTFNERLRRIEAERARAKGRILLHVGGEEIAVRSLAEIAPEICGEKPRRLGGLKAVLAFALGTLAVALAVALKVRFMPVSVEQALSFGEGQTVVMLALGAGLSFVLTFAFGLRGGAAMTGQMLGVVLAVSALHNLAFWAPGAAEMLFTKDWVEVQRVSAVPDSLIFRGVVYTL